MTITSPSLMGVSASGTPTATDMFLEGKDRELLDRQADAAPLERLGVPDDIAPVVAFLASPEGHWINGQTVRVNGGII